MRRHLVASLVGVGLSGAWAAGAETWQVSAEPASTRVAFSLGTTLHEVAGSADLVFGQLTLDFAAGVAEGKFVIDATSLRTGNKKRDRDMHRKVLESATYPQIVFLADRVNGELPAAGDFELELAGRLEIHATSHPLTFAIAGSRDGERVAATTRFDVPYVELGMKDPSKLFLRAAKVVAVAIEMTARLSPGKEPEPQ